MSIIENMIKRGSVTSKIKNINLKEAISDNLIPDIKNVKKYNNDMIHCFNDIPSNYKCILGTSTDYLIRKMIHEVRNEPIDEKLICEKPINLETADNSPWVKTIYISEGKDRFNYIFQQAYENEALLDIKKNEIKYIDRNELNKYKQYVKNYRTKHWYEVLNDIWEMSLLDTLFRCGHYEHINCYEELLNKDHKFYKFLMVVANNFRDKTKKIYYNPTLGRSKNNIKTKADADIIYGDEMIDWKCTKKKDYSKDMLQCLMYTALARDIQYNHNINKCKVYYLLYETETELNVEDWDENGFINKYCI